MTGIKLPVIGQEAQTMRHGRNIAHGYQRGWGLEFGDLADQIRRNPLYQEAVKLAEGRTIQSERNRMNIFLLLTHYLPHLQPGHIAEFGAFKGGSAIFMAHVCRKVLPGTKVFAFDTFTGMPDTDHSIDAHRAGDFADADYEGLQQKIASEGLDNLILVRGLFEDTLPDVRDSLSPLRLVHIDADIKSACQYAYEGTKDIFVPGGYVVFDDALYSSCLGATEVVEDVLIARDNLRSEQVYPQFVFRMGLDRAAAE